MKVLLCSRYQEEMAEGDDDELKNHDHDFELDWRRRQKLCPRARRKHLTHLLLPRNAPWTSADRAPPDTKKAHTVFVSNLKNFFPLLCANAVLFRYGANSDVCAVWFKKSGKTCEHDTGVEGGGAGALTVCGSIIGAPVLNAAAQLSLGYLFNRHRQHTSFFSPPIPCCGGLQKKVKWKRKTR